MPVTAPPQRPKRDLSKVVSTRGGSVAVAALTALLAAALLMVFLTRYRDSVNNNDKLTTVLVAQRVIEKGSSGDVIATQGLYQTSRLPNKQLKNGALSDPGAIRGKVATQDVLPGQQLTTADFAPSTDPIVKNLAGNQRAIALPLDSAHGMIGDVHSGDRVDVLAGFNWQPNGAASSVPVSKVLLQNASTESRLHTDESMSYRKVGLEFAAHERVNHGEKEYARGDVTTNTIEGYFSIFKRGMKGIYQHCGEPHLHRYLAEFDFRYNARAALGVDDTMRADKALKGVVGKRLTYRTTSSARA